MTISCDPLILQFDWLSSGCTAAGGSDQALLGYNPMYGMPLQHQVSNVTEEGYVHSVTGQPLSIPNSHKRWSDSPLLDDRFASTPMAADQLNDGKHIAGTGNGFQFSPFSRADSNRAVFDALPRMEAAHLNRLGSGQYRGGKIAYAPGLSRVGSGPGQLRSGLVHQGYGLQHLQEPMLATDDSAAGDSVVMHKTHSLLQQQGQGASASSRSSVLSLKCVSYLIAIMFALLQCIAHKATTTQHSCSKLDSQQIVLATQIYVLAFCAVRAVVLCRLVHSGASSRASGLQISFYACTTGKQ